MLANKFAFAFCFTNCISIFWLLHLQECNDVHVSFEVINQRKNTSESQILSKTVFLFNCAALILRRAPTCVTYYAKYSLSDLCMVSQSSPSQRNLVCGLLRLHCGIFRLFQLSLTGDSYGLSFGLSENHLLTI